ncbi:hypothetical protein FKM82_002735 [Ascaphus truei]
MEAPEESDNASALREHIRRLSNENVQLQDRNERLYAKLGELQEKMGKLAGSKTDLSSRLVFSEEEKLKVRAPLIAMGKELQEAKRAIRNTQHKIAEQSAVLLTSQSQLKEVESENSRLQLQLKELNEEYRSRLNRYIQDLADYVDGTQRAGRAGKSQGGPDGGMMSSLWDSMLSDIKASHRVPRGAAASAGGSHKAMRMQTAGAEHEKPDSMQREQILALEHHDLDPGPPEYHLSITDLELQSESGQELNRLREDKARLETQIQELQEKVASRDPGGVRGKLNEENWAEIRKQLREFTHNTQEELEKERGQLLSRAVIAEEQVEELQEYVDKHLGRYKQEIMRLRKLLGNESPRAFSADNSYSLFHRAGRRSSHEM